MKTTIIFPNDLVDKHYNSTMIAALATIIIVGIMFIFSHNIIDYEYDTPLSILITCGVFATIVASIVLSFSLKDTTLSSSGSPLICKKIEFYESDYERIKELATENKWVEIKSIAKNGNGIAMKLEFVYSKDKRFAAYQIFKYVPHSFEPCSEIFYINKEYISHIVKS